eukprot:6920151-Pyramimonas_sp.AAC.2
MVRPPEGQKFQPGCVAPLPAVLTWLAAQRPDGGPLPIDGPATKLVLVRHPLPSRDRRPDDGVGGMLVRHHVPEGDAALATAPILHALLRLLLRAVLLEEGGPLPAHRDLDGQRVVRPAAVPNGNGAVRQLSVVVGNEALRVGREGLGV